MFQRACQAHALFQRASQFKLTSYILAMPADVTISDFRGLFRDVLDAISVIQLWIRELYEISRTNGILRDNINKELRT